MLLTTVLSGSQGEFPTVRAPAPQGRLAQYLAHGESSISTQEITIIIIIMESIYYIYTTEEVLVEMLYVHKLLFLKKEHLSKFGDEEKS